MTLYDKLTFPQETHLLYADSVARFCYEETPQQVFDIRDFPGLRLPFPSLFIEWAEPRHYMMEDGTLKPVWKHAYELALKQGLEPDYGYLKTLNRRCGMLLYERLGEGRHRIFAHPMVEENGALKSIPPFVWYFEVNALGQARDMDGDGGGYLKIAVNPQEVDPEQVRVAANTLRVYLDIALYTLSLLNCRNVELVEREANPKRRRTENRPRGKKYYVLGVKAFSTRTKRETAQEPGYKVRHHFRRGHFRDYTQGAGLFGKYPGVYWFGPASVGAVDLGEIHKDYDFKK